MHHKIYLLTLSNVFQYSGKLIFSDAFHSTDRSTMICTLVVWLVHGIQPVGHVTNLSSVLATLAQVSLLWNIDEMSLLSRILLDRMSSAFADTSVSDVSASACILSRSAPFPHLTYPMTILISSIFGGVFVDAASRTGIFNEARIFRFSSKCSIHFLLCPWIPVIGLPHFSVRGPSGLLYLPASFFFVS